MATQSSTVSPRPSLDTYKEEGLKVQREMEEILEKYTLKMENCDKKITERHLQDISRSLCKDWRSLPVHLSMNQIVVHDIEQTHQDESKRRVAFLLQWEKEKGSEATYKTLISSLLHIKCKKDAEEVCKLVADSGGPSSCKLDSSTTTVHTPGATDDQKMAKPTASSASMSVLPEVFDDLRQQLESNLEDIQNQYASYVSSIRSSLQMKEISAEELRTHLLNLPAFHYNHDSKELKLLSGRSVKFEGASTINEVFKILSLECCTYLDYGIFQSIVKYYDLDTGNEHFQYPDRVKKYLNLHNIKEFTTINPNLSSRISDDSERLILKLDIDSTSKLSKLEDIKIKIAKILGLKSSALQLLDIKEGCVMVTYFIPGNIATAVFTSNKKFTEDQIKEFHALSVLWLKYQNYKFPFNGSSLNQDPDDAILSNLLKRHQIDAKKIQENISESHLQEFSSICKNWRCLQPYLNFEEEIDIADEKGKRKFFFQKWADEGPATYYNLFNALIKTGNNKDAEYMCKLLQDRKNPIVATRSMDISSMAVPADSRLGDLTENVGLKFGQRRPPLSITIREILQKYPDGQIFKEMIQNADDAGATAIQFYVDCRQHGSRGLVKPELALYQGPALISANNAIFSDQDWEGIQNLQQSNKFENPFKVGRFGMGFNSIYNLTDVPLIISGSKAAFLEPQEQIWRGEPGQLYNLGYLCGTDHLKPLDGIADFTASTSYYQKTLFRFPLRTSASGLSKNCYNTKKVNQLLDAFKSEAMHILLFLRSIHSIEVYNIGEDGKHDLSFKVKLSDESATNHIRKQTSFLKQITSVHTEKQYDFSKVIKFIVELEVSFYDETAKSYFTGHWLVSSRFDSTNATVREASIQLKVFPWVGTAVELDNPGNGRIFCVLPMPIETAYNLPVHVNGTFCLTDDRRSLKWPELERKNDPTAAWNELLVKEILPKCYADLMLEAKPRLLYSFYKAWPDLHQLEGTHWYSLLHPLFEILLNEKVILSESCEWITPKVATFIPKSTESMLSIPNVVKEALTQCGVKLSAVPLTVWKALECMKFACHYSEPPTGL